jgi:hypothetical protein
MCTAVSFLSCGHLRHARRKGRWRFRQRQRAENHILSMRVCSKVLIEDQECVVKSSIRREQERQREGGGGGGKRGKTGRMGGGGGEREREREIYRALVLILFIKSSLRNWPTVKVCATIQPRQSRACLLPPRYVPWPSHSDSHLTPPLLPRRDKEGECSYRPEAGETGA